MDSNVSDLREYRKKKKRRKRIRRTLICVLILTVTVVVYAFRENWIPYFEDFVDNVKYEMFVSKKNKNAKFPADIISSTTYNEQVIDDKIAILTDTYYNVYDNKGNVCFSDQHVMSNPVMKMSSNRALIYDQGAKKLVVETKLKRLYSKTVDNKIMYADISNKGYVGVVTESSKYTSFLTVYNQQGKKIFYASNSEKIIGLDFTNDSKGCIVSTISSQGGQLVTKVTGYNFSKEKSIFTSKAYNTLGLDLEVLSGGRCVLVGDTQAVFLNDDGKEISSVTYDSSLDSYCVDDDKLVVYINNTELRKNTVEIISSSGKPVIINVNKNVRDIIYKNSVVYTLSEESINKYSSNGNPLREIKTQGNYDQMVIIKKDAYLVGHEVLDKIYVGT